MIATCAGETVQASRLNLAIVADLKQYIAKLERGKKAAKIASRTQREIVGHLSGGKQVIDCGKNLCIADRLLYEDV